LAASSRPAIPRPILPNPIKATLAMSTAHGSAARHEECENNGDD
jgi:hypothetical protein